MTPDLKGFTETRLIPNTEAVDFLRLLCIEAEWNLLFHVFFGLLP